MPDTANLLRCIAGETVFGLDTDSRIRQAANGMSALLLIELFHRCDESKPGWEAEFAEALSEFSTGDPSALVALDNGQFDHLPSSGESSLAPIPEANFTYYLKLIFRNEDAAYYQFPLFPAMDDPFLAGGSRKREGNCQHVRVDLPRPGDLQLFIERLRHNPHLIAVEESSEETFHSALSHGV
jgi:hypothetical protein